MTPTIVGPPPSPSAINLVPGATPARFQNAVTDTPGRALTTNVNGQERGANNTRVDGSADILVTMPHHAVYVPPVESIQEVNIATNNFDAEQGMTGGAAVTVITKSGTNTFRGTAFALHDNSALRTFTWDENRAGITDKPTGTRNIDGGNFGGPIKKNTLFFFGNYEGTFEDTVKEIQEVIGQMTDDERRHYLSESLFLNFVSYENQRLGALLKKLPKEV